MCSTARRNLAFMATSSLWNCTHLNIAKDTLPRSEFTDAFDSSIWRYSWSALSSLAHLRNEAASHRLLSLAAAFVPRTRARCTPRTCSTHEPNAAALAAFRIRSRQRLTAKR